MKRRSKSIHSTKAATPQPQETIRYSPEAFVYDDDKPIKENGEDTNFSSYLNRLKTTDQTVTLDISSSMAKEMLSYITKQRPLINTTVQRYSREMKEERWVLTGECLIFGRNGALLNGQHRLRAVIRSGKTVTMDVRFGINPEYFPKIDRLHPRSASDIFGMLGEKNCAPLSAMTRVVWQYENTKGMRIAWKEPEPEQLWEYMNERHPDLRKYIETHKLTLKAGWGLRAGISAYHYLCATTSGKEEADLFFYMFLTGRDIPTWSPKHPVNKLRDEFERNHKNKQKGGQGLKEEYRYAMIVKSFNAWVAGRERTTLAWRSQSTTEKFPRIKP